MLKDKVRLARKAAGLTQKKLGEKVGITKQAISLIENGTTENPDKRTLKLIAQATNDNLGLPELNDSSIERSPNRQKIINSATANEIINSLKFNAGAGTYSREDIVKIKQLADKSLDEIKTQNEKLINEQIACRSSTNKKKLKIT